MLALPVRLHERTLGELTLFYNAQVEPSPAERSLLEALVAHLSAAMESLRLDSLAKEAAVSDERNLLARELHDSIAQSLAFLKIQVQLMRDALASGDAQRSAAVLAEIDAGVRESYGDVRELLLHFRTRANHGHIEPALQTTLRKFEHQSGVKASLSMQGTGLPLPPDVARFDLWVMLAALVACLPVFLTGREIARWEGGLFLGYYVAYVAYLVLLAQQSPALGAFALVSTSVVLPLTVIVMVVVMVQAAAANPPRVTARRA